MLEIFGIYAVKDEMTNTFLQPTFIKKDEEAIRLFKYQINNTPIWKDNPEDFSLYYLGTYDQETGTVIGITPNKITGGRAVRTKGAENDI